MEKKREGLRSQSRMKKGPRGKGPGFKAGPGRAEPERGRFFQKKTCRFCSERATIIDYKDAERLRRFLTEKGKVLPARITGTCAKHQRMLARAIKKSRHAALIPFHIA